MIYAILFFPKILLVVFFEFFYFAVLFCFFDFLCFAKFSQNFR